MDAQNNKEVCGDNGSNPFHLDRKLKRKYEDRKVAEEIRELQEKYKDEEIEETESEESSYEESEGENEQIIEIIEKIRNKDPEIYTDKEFFTQKITEKLKKEKSFKLRELHREQTLDAMHKVDRVEKKMKYNVEQEEAIDTFISQLDKMNISGEILQKKELKSEEEDLRDLPEEEFLNRYVLQGKWKKTEEPENNEEFLEQDSEELEMAEAFDASSLPIPGSSFSTAKKPSQERKRKELKKRLRKREEEKVREEEIKRLKNLKKKQFSDRLSLLKKISGLSNRKISKINLSDQYNEKEMDKLISSLFDEKYFQESEKTKPEVKGSLPEAQELKDLEDAAKKGEMLNDRVRTREIKKIVEEIKKIGEEYDSLRIKGDFSYVELPNINIPLSIKDIFTADENLLKKQFPIKKFAPYQSKEEIERLNRSLEKENDPKK
ncbi:hypothetical protein NEFER03_0193 [Nematocida sp. LUAm3]|nr:hypothetical protein NEFER03_0193 [Nematocida sp. LUAm3]KAI5173646.1 hypothetical protein NEFER02_0162 [Nematocida sp. LUAm2]KAI5176867.1 hypothetical protein NEFER01_0192 [Nematocida sp. LUAm1]